MKSPRPLIFLSILLSTFFLQHHAIPAPAPAPASYDAAGADFIRTNCNSTLYPDVCYSSLSGYASAVQHDSAQLARVAIGVTLSEAKRMVAYVSNFGDPGPDPRAAAALHDCRSNFGDAVEEINESLKQMRQIRSSSGMSSSRSSFRFQMSNVQTWMSAALTDGETCTDGFEDVADGKMKKDVCDRAEFVKKLMSIALALVNRYVEIGKS